MRESLRKISQLTLLAWIVLFGKQSEIVAHIEQALEQFSRFLFPAEKVPAIGEPKRAGKKCSFGSWQSINARFLWSIAQHEAILH